MVPPGVGRRVREIPSRMLKVASVAMIEGIFTPRMRPALTRPTASAVRKIAPSPTRSSTGDDSGWIMNEAMTTERPIIAPIDRSR